jgi:hypothetical protein
MGGLTTLADLLSGGGGKQEAAAGKGGKPKRAPLGQRSVNAINVPKPNELMATGEFAKRAAAFAEEDLTVVSFRL